MARIRKFSAYRSIERPYTRISKYRKKSYIRVRPNIHVVKYDMGNPSKDWPLKLELVSKSDLQIRHNALESARQTSNKVLETTLGKGAYHLKLRLFPHHILRENPLASGAGADRMSTGMKMSFGKAIGTAARVFKGQTIFSLGVDKSQEDVAKKALRRAASKLPCHCGIKVVSAA